ncbi:MAG: cob(I)yrinic acid a,c-diamide adenosyltransferase [Candidatus Rehaiarchaeum fermentans]|nr:cob(I)yrinic acid a,c-diamide adenosyltransferase [Candidatus Rehaiarchaeum fermentans]MCW1302079.1 cob(I)yrinic acid a,c-diamide adenosyltransferase [Candidatus Rehaiarchaeum fermentans]
MMYYSGRGDDGYTDLKGERVRKDCPAIELIGELDKLAAHIGLALSEIVDKEIRETLEEVERHIYLISAKVSGFITKEKEKELEKDLVAFIEEKTNYFGSKIPDISKFVKPNGSKAATLLNVCRTLARECERTAIKEHPEVQIIKYLNRLSSLLFVLFRYQNMLDGYKEEYY